MSCSKQKNKKQHRPTDDREEFLKYTYRIKVPNILIMFSNI